MRLQPIGSAPHLNQRVFKLSTNQRFETIVRFLRKRLGVKEHESVFCYVGSVFSPALDEGVGNLWTVGRSPRKCKILRADTLAVLQAERRARCGLCNLTSFWVAFQCDMHTIVEARLLNLY